MKSAIIGAHGIGATLHSKTTKCHPNTLWRKCVINNTYKVNTENQEAVPQREVSLRYSRDLNFSKAGSGQTTIERATLLRMH